MSNGFYGRWIIATTIGFTVGAVLSAIAPPIFIHIGDVRLSMNLSVIFTALIIGASIGFLQWDVLRYELYPVHQWILATIAGWVIGSCTTLLLAEFIGAGVGIITTGLLIGVAQWLVIRKRVNHSIVWILATTTSWIISIAIMWIMTLAVGADVGALVAILPAGGCLGSIINGLITETVARILSAPTFAGNFSGIGLLEQAFSAPVLVYPVMVLQSLITGVFLVWVLRRQANWLTLQKPT